ncbi:hypothetical protein FACS189490_07880 [Clostridia bacterium]|nr:hypothetical protein FACS189490_07880 [Clostridia bacterium]
MGEIIFNGSSFTITINSADGGAIDFGDLGAFLDGLDDSLDGLNDNVSALREELHNDIMFIGELIILTILFLIGRSIYGFFRGL